MLGGVLVLPGVGVGVAAGEGTEVVVTAFSLESGEAAGGCWDCSGNTAEH